MATDAIIVLERLTCIRESDGSGGSEPYIWPGTIWIDDNTLSTPALVGVSSPALHQARVVIKADMRAGQVADIPSAVAMERVRLEDNQSVRRLILAVALWENDDTPETAMFEGCKAFGAELSRAVADNLLALSQASTPDQLQPIIDAIKARVSGKVESAIRNGLSGPQKVQVYLNLLNLDDFVGSDFKSFPQLTSQPLRLVFASNENPPSNQYAIDGQLLVRPVVVDPCAALVARVGAAQGAVNDIENEIRSLQAQLRGQIPTGEPPLPKPFIVAEIKRLRTEELPPAEAALEAARGALAQCRNRPMSVVAAGAGILAATG